MARWVESALVHTWTGTRPRTQRTTSAATLRLSASVR
jgi:hypothetical protein